MKLAQDVLRCHHGVPEWLTGVGVGEELRDWREMGIRENQGRRWLTVVG